MRLSVLFLASLMATGCAQVPSEEQVLHPVRSAISSTDLNHQLNRALKAMESGNYEEALPILESLSGEHGTPVTVLVNLGITYRRLNRIDDAERTFQRAIASSDKNAIAYNELGIAYRMGGEFAASRGAYETALELRPDYAPPHLNLGVLCELYLQDPACAISHYERYLLLTDSPAVPVSDWLAVLRAPEAQQ